MYIESGVGEDVLKVLTEQKVLSERVFRAMKEEHIVRLLQCSGMPVSGHALLWELGERDYAESPHVPSDIPSEFIKLCWQKRCVTQLGTLNLF